MTSLTGNVPAPFLSFVSEVDDLRLWKIDADVAAGTTLYCGAGVQFDAAVGGEVRDIQANATSGFAGILLDEGVAGDEVRLRRRCLLRLSMKEAVAAGDEGTVVHMLAATPSNNPADITATVLNNLPCGKIAAVITAGASGVNDVILLIEADGYR
jgi:hypothetical protein